MFLIDVDRFHLAGEAEEGCGVLALLLLNQATWWHSKSSGCKNSPSLLGCGTDTSSAPSCPAHLAPRGPLIL